MGHLVVPLKAVLPFYAQAANHPLPGDLIYADGSTLGTNTHGIEGGSSPYVLPNLLNKFIIGADRTTAAGAGEGGQYIEFISNMTASANSYQYQYADFPVNYTIQSGDYLQYDVYWPSANIPSSGGGCGAVDLACSDGSLLRSTNPNDTNGLAAHPNTDLRAYAVDQWYRRRITLSAWTGKILNGYILAHEYDGTFASLRTRFRHIYITNAAGDQINYVLWQPGDGVPVYTAHAVASATFVSGNTVGSAIPGPNSENGSHQRPLRPRHIPAHNHTGSTSTDGSHAHGTSITAHGSHSHNPSGGGNFVYSNSTTQARTGSAYFNITCTMASISSAGNHNHSVSPGADGAHGHNLSITTASNAGVNAASTPFDPRPRWYGMVWTVKSGKPSARAISIPMGTVIMWYADLQNETLPNSFSYCDGSSLTAGNHNVPNSLGSLSYTLALPDLRNRSIIGADRTKNFGTVGSAVDGPSGATGPGATGGVHSLAITVTNLPDHGHSGGTDTQWTTHNHNWSIGNNGDHSHGPAALFLTSTTGTVEIQSAGGAPVTEQKATGTATATTTDDSHAHTFFIGTAGSHGHTVTINSAGSGTTWDNRSPSIGVIFLMKTNIGLASVPLKTVVGFRATTINEAIVPLDSTWAYCNGSTLTPGQFDMTANSGANYVLPNFVSNFPIGADRTKVVGNTGGLTDTAADAPGPKATVGSATATLSVSNMPPHGHAATADTQGAHAHGGSVGTSVGGGHAHSTGCHTYFALTDGVYHSAGFGSFDHTPNDVGTYSSVVAANTQPGHSTSGDTQGAHSHAVTVNNTGSGSAVQQQPRSHGMVFYMKVKR